MFKILKENKIVGVFAEYPKNLWVKNVEVVEEDEHAVDDYIQANGEHVLKTSDKAVEQKKTAIRFVRNQYLADTDKFMIADFPITDEERTQYRAYRQYLRDYTKTDGWFEKEPATFGDWK